MAATAAPNESCEGRPTGFTLRREAVKGRLGNNIHRIDFDPQDPNAVILTGIRPWVEGTQLVYAPGLDPYVNITDERDMALPAFGPLPIADEAMKSSRDVSR